MRTECLLPYPSDQDIRYARWLKHFAAQLPANNYSYGLTSLQVFRIHSLAVEFTILLVQQLQYATASIERQKHPSAQQLHKALHQQVVVEKRFVQETISKLLHATQRRLAWAGSNGYAQELITQGLLLASYCAVQTDTCTTVALNPT